jgi:hypothetical protein
LRRATASVALVLLTASCGGATATPRQVDVSGVPGPQNEVSAAVDPTHPNVLFAGSNSFGEQRTRAYTSTDGGRTWTTAFAPPEPPDYVFEADPAVTIDARGREYFAALEFTSARMPRLFVTVRRGPHAPWSAPVSVDAAAVGLAPYVSDDKDVIANDGTHVYLTWSRYMTWTSPKRHRYSIVVSRSDDGGRTWSRPVDVDRSAREIPLYASVAAAGRLVWVAWQSAFGGSRRTVLVARSTDRGTHFAAPVRVSVPACRPGDWKLPAAPETGAPPAPFLVRAGSRLAVTYGSRDCRGRPFVHVALLDRALRKLSDRVLGQGFFAVPAYDGVERKLWVCWYATRDDVNTRYTCAVDFAKPRAAASVESNETGPHAAHGFSGREYGDYEGLAVADGIAHPFWTDSRDLNTLGEEIYTTTLKAWK